MVAYGVAEDRLMRYMFESGNLESGMHLEVFSFQWRRKRSKVRTILLVVLEQWSTQKSKVRTIFLGKCNMDQL
jgi:hypothetical protein